MIIWITHAEYLERTFYKEIHIVQYGLFSSGETGILYRDGESVEAASIRRYVGRMMSGVSRGERPANFSTINQSLCHINY